MEEQRNRIGSKLLREQIRKKRLESDITQDKTLMAIRSAKTRAERTRCILAARKEGYSYELIGIAAGVTRQRVHQIIQDRAVIRPGSWKFDDDLQ
jgi:hypothetical protein